MSNLQDLKTKQLAAADNLNAINNDPNFQSLRARTTEAFNTYKELSAKADALSKSGAPPQEVRAAEQQAAAAQDAAGELNQQFAVLFKQQKAYKAEYDSYTAQIAQLGTTQTSPTNNVEQAGQQVTERATQVAEQTNPPNPPRPEENLPTSDDDPLGYAPTNQQPTSVLSQREINLIESYNRNLVASGLDPVDPNGSEARDLIERFQSEQRSPPISVTISGVLGDPAIDSQVVETFEEGNPEIDSQFTETIDEPRVQTLVNTAREQTVGRPAPDWRVRIQLADQADYFYNSANPGILAPLRITNGVLFPYLPQITVSYTANYTPLDVVHTNYKFYSYKNSSVESITIAADFTAQNTVEANYLLAVIHFFRSVSKMFYGQDQNPSRGIPPPICYLSGHGEYQFNKHPMVLTNFTYNLPVDVDYISAYPTNPTSSIGGIDLAPYTPTAARSFSPLDRLRSLVSSGIAKGGLPPPPNFQRSQNISEITRVPTKMNMQLTFLPIATRNAVSNKFSLKDYASGSLLRGSVNPGTGGGFW